MPSVQVLGAYRLPVTESLFKEQFEILYPDMESNKQREAAERHVREQLESVVLLDVMVVGADEAFDSGDFYQEVPGCSRDDSQVAYAEMIVGVDGETVLAKQWAARPDVSDFRELFYIHYWDPSLPLHTSYGSVKCPAPQPMPERLYQMAPYEPAD